LIGSSFGRNKAGPIRELKSATLSEYGLIGSWQIPELADFQRITGSRPTPEEFCLKLAYGGRPLHGHEFRCQTSKGIFN
jgi:hypothetical protein